MALRIELATKKDVPVILAFIKDLADYEKLSHEVRVNVEDLNHNLFGPKPYAEVIIAYWDDNPVGFALFFHNFSTFLGKPGIYLEDLYIKPEARAKGAGKKLLAYLARLAKQRNCGRLEWAVLDWNTPAIEFYKRLGATAMNDWTVFRLTGNALKSLAETEF